MEIEIVNSTTDKVVFITIAVLTLYSTYMTDLYLKNKKEIKSLKQDVFQYEKMAEQRQYSEIIRKSTLDKIGKWKKKY